MDTVDRPPHYTNGSIEAIDYMKDNMSPEAFKGYLEGCVKKYLHRHRYKNHPLEDLKKARWYLDKLVTELEAETPQIVSVTIKPPNYQKFIPGTVNYGEY